MLTEMDVERTLVKFIISNKGEETYYGVSTTTLREYIYLMRDAKGHDFDVMLKQYMEMFSEDIKEIRAAQERYHAGTISASEMKKELKIKREDI